MSPDLPRSTGCLIAPKMGINSHHIVGIKYRRHHIVGIKYNTRTAVCLMAPETGTNTCHYIVVPYTTSPDLPRSTGYLIAPQTGTNTCHYIEGTINLQCLQTNRVLLTI